MPFRVTKPFASFLVGGGSHAGTCVELVRKDTGEVIFRASGDDREDMERVVVDLSGHLGKEIVIRLVDAESGGWGHINFDDFRLHDTKPDVPPRRRPRTPDVYRPRRPRPRRGRPGDDRAARVQGHALRRRARRRPADRVGDRRPRPALGRRGVFLSRARARGPGARTASSSSRTPTATASSTSARSSPIKLNLVSGLEVGFGGVWVGAAPQLPVHPRPATATTGPTARRRSCSTAGASRTRTRRSTRSPGARTAGSTAATASSRTRASASPGTPDAERTPINAGIWRYHPTRHVFEVFAHGTSNPWGIDFDEHGQVFVTACVIPHLYHMIQGGRYERQAGQHFNPYTYDDIKTIADHRHYLGANPHGGNGRSDAAGGGHAHAGAMIYQGGAWPAEYRGSLFMNNIHGARLNRDILEAAAARASSARTPPTSCWPTTVWSQIISLKYGPDGSVYMIDWYDKNQCHHNDVNGHDRTNGRIFKVSYGETKHGHSQDLAKLSNRDARRRCRRRPTSGMPGTPAASSRSEGRAPR